MYRHFIFQDSLLKKYLTMLQIFTVLDNIFVNGSSYRSLEVVVPFEEGIVHKPCYTGIKIDPLGRLSLVLS